MGCSGVLKLKRNWKKVQNYLHKPFLIQRRYYSISFQLYPALKRREGKKLEQIELAKRLLSAILDSKDLSIRGKISSVYEKEFRISYWSRIGDNRHMRLQILSGHDITIVSYIVPYRIWRSDSSTLGYFNNFTAWYWGQTYDKFEDGSRLHH